MCRSSTPKGLIADTSRLRQLEQRRAEHAQPARADGRTDLRDRRRGPDSVDRHARMRERTGKANQLRNLGNVDRNGLLHARAERQIERFGAEIQRSARRYGDLRRFRCDRPIDARDAIRQRQSYDRALQLGRRVACAKGIDRLHQVVERVVEVELRVDERRRAHDDGHRAGRAARPCVRRNAARHDVHVERGLAAAHRTRRARGSENRRQIEVLSVELHHELRRSRMRGVERNASAQRAAERAALQARDIELAVLQCQRNLHVGELEPFIQRDARHRQLAVGVERSDTFERERTVFEDELRGLLRGNRRGCRASRRQYGQIAEHDDRRCPFERIFPAIAGA